MPRSNEEIAAELRARAKHTLATALGIEFREVTAARVVATMPVDARTRQPFGLLHGGASAALAETLASVGGTLNIDVEQFAAVGIELNANHLRSKRDGVVTGTATPIHIGRSTQVWDIRIVDEQDRLVCVSRCTLAVVPRTPSTTNSEHD
ncbi:MAG TPA: hotdog fold thioesterase [Gemmatimonadaceae bacterium]|nr:hotdog fold thioesterase [Gemmatimonadaceae bacterium]